MVTKMVQRLDEQLDAKKIHIVSFEGKVTDTVDLVDNAGRLAAIKATGELFDVYRPRTDSAGGTRPVIVNLQWPAWAGKPPIKIDDDTLTIG